MNSHTAVVLLSGGLDSAVVLAMARARGLACHALGFDYGQRHRAELRAAEKIAAALGAATHRTVRLDLRCIGGSALTDAIDVPKDGAGGESGPIPVTYVPARNITFLAIACGLAEATGAGRILLGVNAVDYSGYPDCRPEFIAAFQRCIDVGTKAGVEGGGAGGGGLVIEAPLVRMTKADIIREGVRLGVDLSVTSSCYDPLGEDGLACGRCDSCRIRRRGFAEAGVPDPTRYASNDRASDAGS